MTGLDPYRGTIVEVAVIITDGDLRREVIGPNIVVHHTDEVLASMNEWSTKQHGESGLTARSRASTVTLAAAEESVLAFVLAHCRRGEKVQLAGACVYKDREFIDAHMPSLAKALHHRIVDVSSVRELARRWYQADYHAAPRSVAAHRALDDIRHTIEELKHYRRAIFRPPAAEPEGRGSAGGRERRGKPPRGKRVPGVGRGGAPPAAPAW